MSEILEAVAETYYRVSPKIWLEPWSDDARTVALYLLTCRHRTIEGLYLLPIGYAAADLEWYPERLAEPFAQLSTAGFLSYDENARVVFIRKALKYQAPANPNMDKAAARRLALLPETALFVDLLEAARAYCPRLAEALPRLLPERYREPLPEPFGKQTRNSLALALALNSSSSSKDPLVNRPAAPAAPPAEIVDEIAEEFEAWWAEYGRVGDKARARDLYSWWRRQGSSAEELLAAAGNYRRHCSATDCKIKHAATFLAKPARDKSPVWPEWATGEAHGGMEPRRDSILSDVLEAGAEAFGLTGGNRYDSPDTELRSGSARALASGPDPRRGVPARRLAGGE